MIIRNYRLQVATLFERSNAALRKLEAVQKTAEETLRQVAASSLLADVSERITTLEGEPCAAEPLLSLFLDLLLLSAQSIIVFQTLPQTLHTHMTLRVRDLRSTL